MKLERKPDFVKPSPNPSSLSPQNAMKNPNSNNDLPVGNYGDIAEDIKPLDPEYTGKSGGGVFRGFLSTFIIACAFTGLAVLGWFAYQENSEQTDVAELPVIEPDEGDFKAPATGQTGTEIPNTDKKIFDAISSSGTEGKNSDFMDDSNITFLNPVEEPIERNSSTTQNQGQNAKIGAINDATNNIAAASDPSSTHENVAMEIKPGSSFETALSDNDDTTNIINKNADTSTPANDNIPPAQKDSTPATSQNISVDKISGQAPLDKTNSANVVSSTSKKSEELIDNSAKPDSAAFSANVSKATPENKIAEKTDGDKKWKVVKLAEIPATPASKLSGKVPAAGKSSPAGAKSSVADGTSSSKNQKLERVELASLSPAKPASSSGGRSLVQLGSFKSQEGLEKGWILLKRKFGKLNGLRKSIEMVNLGDKGIYYRLHAGPLSKSEAQDLCKEMKSQSQACIVVK